jgi:hypothetical protein
MDTETLLFRKLHTKVFRFLERFGIAEIAVRGLKVLPLWRLDTHKNSFYKIIVDRFLKRSIKR